MTSPHMADPEEMLLRFLQVCRILSEAALADSTDNPTDSSDPSTQGEAQSTAPDSRSETSATTGMLWRVWQRARRGRAPLHPHRPNWGVVIARAGALAVRVCQLKRWLAARGLLGAAARRFCTEEGRLSARPQQVTLHRDLFRAPIPCWRTVGAHRGGSTLARPHQAGAGLDLPARVWHTCQTSKSRNAQ